LELSGGALDITNGFSLYNPGTVLDHSGGTLTSGGQVSVTADIFGGATYNLSGGTLVADSLLVSGGTFNWTSGTLAVGVGTFSGNYSQPAAGTLSISLGGTTEGSEYDYIEASAVASLSGVLDVELVDLGGGLFDPQVGDVFDLVRAETITGSFDSLLLPTLGAGLFWNFATYVDAIGSTDVFRLSVSVPEPSVAALWLGAGLALLAARARPKP